MNFALWIVQVLLAAVFAVSGGAKLVQPRLALAGRMSWVTQATDAQVKTIGVLEVLAAIGLVAPPLVHIAAFLTPLAACGAVLLMIGASLTHLKMREPERLAVTIPVLLLALFVAVARFGAYPF